MAASGCFFEIQIARVLQPQWDFPIKNGDFPWQNVSSPEGNEEKQGRFGKSLLQSTFCLLNELGIFGFFQSTSGNLGHQPGCQTDAPFPKVYDLVVVWY